MKKKLIITFCLSILLLSGCKDKNTLILTCVQYDNKTITTIKNNRIVEINENGQKEKVTREEWKTIKNFYELEKKVTNEEIANVLKEKNESNGFTCTIK